MSRTLKIDLVRKYCGGAGNRFAGIVCEFYIQLTGLCKLLDAKKLENIISKGRCKPYDHIASAVIKCLKKFADMIRTTDIQSYADSISFNVLERIKEKKLEKGFNLPTLYSYIRRTAYTEVYQQMFKEKDLVRKQCGNCSYLSAIKPYKCQNVGSPNNGMPNEYFEVERKKIDKACELFIKKDIELSYDRNVNLANEVENIGDEHTIIETENKFEYFDLLKLLKNRINGAKSETKRKTLKRHYIVITSLYHYLSYGYSISKAKETIAKKINMNVKTIDRDLKEIRQTFKNYFLFA